MLCTPIGRATRTRRGMVTAQVVMSMGVLMAILALVTDVGVLLVERRHAQATADAAALAAASDLYANWNSNQGSDSGHTAKTAPWASQPQTAMLTTAPRRPSRSPSRRSPGPSRTSPATLK